MKHKKYLKIVGGVLFALLAVGCASHISGAWALLDQVSDQNRHLAVSILLGTYSGVILWSGVSFYLFRSASKTNEKPAA